MKVLAPTTATLTVTINIDPDGHNNWMFDDVDGTGLAEAIADLVEGAGAVGGTVTVNI